jgi:hypothetical protein
VSGFELAYLIFGSFLISAGVIMVTTYTITNPWWRSHLGRMMIVYAMAEILMSTLLMVSIVGHVAPHWFRGVWFVLQTTVGCTFWYQTFTIIKLHLRTRREP